MHSLCEYVGAERSVEGDICIILSIEDDEEALAALNELKDTRLTLDLEKYNAKRSGAANRYFWKLCGLISAKLGVDKDTLYLMQLKKYGTFEIWDIPKEAIHLMEPLYRFIEVDHYFSSPRKDELDNEYILPMANIKAFKGSSQYDAKEMAALINGTVMDCQDLGIETWSPEEIANLIKYWRPQE